MILPLILANPVPGLQWEEILLDSWQKIARPRQVYLGTGKRDYVPIEKRKEEGKSATAD